MARVGGRQRGLFVGALLVAFAGALWLGAGVAHANCDPNAGPVDPSMCGGGGMGGSNTPSNPPPDNQSSGSQSVTNNQQSNSGPQVNVATPQPQPQNEPAPQVHHVTPRPQPVVPAATGTDFAPVLPDAPPAALPTPGPAVSLQGLDPPAAGAGTASAAGLPPPISNNGQSSPWVPLALLAAAAGAALPVLRNAGPQAVPFAAPAVASWDMVSPTVAADTMTSNSTASVPEGPTSGSLSPAGLAAKRGCRPRLPPSLRKFLGFDSPDSDPE
jgi:hypothetical protein